MSNKNNDPKFNIPLGAVIVSWFIAPPLGLVLTVLYVVSEINKNKETSGGFSAEKARAEFENKINKIKTETSTKKKGKKRKSKNADTLVMKIIGFFLLILAAFIAFSALMSADTAMTSLSGLLMAVIATVIPAIGGFTVLLCSRKGKSKKEIRFARILLMIGDNDTFDLNRLASASGRSIRQTRRDVQELINSGKFGTQAYIDLGRNYFMRSPAAAESFDAEQNKKDTAPQSPEDFGLNADNGDYKSIIRDIRRLNDEIEDKAVSDRIDRIEAHTKNIFNFVSDHPEAKPQIRTFLNYYLPTTLKLLESYSRIEKVGVAGENMKKSKENIESTLDMLETAFKLQIDDLFKSESIDISSDISVLETMISKDGLDGKHDFDVDSGGAAAQEK